MKLIKSELRDKIYSNVSDKVQEHVVPLDNPARNQIEKNLGLWSDDDLIWLKILNPKVNIMSDLNEIN